MKIKQDGTVFKVICDLRSAFCTLNRIPSSFFNYPNYFKLETEIKEPRYLPFQSVNPKTKFNFSA